jgi:three-Cys-motif partner protein
MPRKKDRWPELCELVKFDDGLPVRYQSGTWTERKLKFWSRYIDMATTAMAGKWKGGLIYVDLFSGPGICAIGKSKRRIPGSTLIAAYAPNPFRRIIACELDIDSATACKQRLKQSATISECFVIAGDCNQRVLDVVARIPRTSLTLAFVDPSGLHAHFETIRILTTDRRVDLLVLFADAVDAIRNEQIYRTQTDSALDQVLGPGSNWRTRLDDLLNPDGTRKRKALAEIYRKQLGTLGYDWSDDIAIRSGRGPLYRLVFASKDKLGLDLWVKTVKKDLGGQTRLF